MSSKRSGSNRGRGRGGNNGGRGRGRGSSSNDGRNNNNFNNERGSRIMTDQTNEDALMYETPVAKGVLDKTLRSANMKMQQYRSEADFKPIISGSVLHNTTRRIVAWPLMTEQVFSKHPKCMGDVNYNEMKCPDDMFISFDKKYDPKEHLRPSIVPSFLNSVKELTDVFSMLVQQSHIGTISGSYPVMRSEEIFFAHELMKKSFQNNVGERAKVAFVPGANESKYTFDKYAATTILKYKTASALGMKKELVEESLNRLYAECCKNIPDLGESQKMRYAENALIAKMNELKKMGENKGSKRKKNKHGRGGFNNNRGNGRGRGRGRRGGRGRSLPFDAFDSEEDDFLLNGGRIGDEDDIEDSDEGRDANEELENFDKEAFMKRACYEFMAKWVGTHYGKENQYDVFLAKHKDDDDETMVTSENIDDMVPSLDASFLRTERHDNVDEMSSNERGMDVETDDDDDEYHKNDDNNDRMEEKIKIYFRMLYAKDNEKKEEEEEEEAEPTNEGETNRMSFETLVQQRAEKEDEPMVRMTIGEKKRSIVGIIVYAEIMDPNWSAEDALDCLFHRSWECGEEKKKMNAEDDMSSDRLCDMDRHLSISETLYDSMMANDFFCSENSKGSGVIETMLAAANGKGTAAFECTANERNAYGLFDASLDGKNANALNRYKLPVNSGEDDHHCLHNMDPLIRGGLGLCRWTDANSLFGPNRTSISSHSFDTRMWQSQADLFDKVLNPKKKATIDGVYDRRDASRTGARVINGVRGMFFILA